MKSNKRHCLMAKTKDNDRRGVLVKQIICGNCKLLYFNNTRFTCLSRFIGEKLSLDGVNIVKSYRWWDTLISSLFYEVIDI